MMFFRQLVNVLCMTSHAYFLFWFVRRHNVGWERILYFRLDPRDKFKDSEQSGRHWEVVCTKYFIQDNSRHRSGHKPQSGPTRPYTMERRCYRWFCNFMLQYFDEGIDGFESGRRKVLNACKLRLSMSGFILPAFPQYILFTPLRGWRIYL